MDSSRRRRFLQTVAGVSTIGLAGCSLFSSEQPGENEEEPPEITDTPASTPTSTPVPVPDDASFGFDYSDGSLTIRLTGGGPIPASNLAIRSSKGTQVRWYELGSTAVPASGSVTSGDTATIGSSVLNWPNAVEQSETIRVLFMTEGSPTTLDTFEPSAEETPTESEDVIFSDDFEDGVYNNTWSVTTHHDVESVTESNGMLTCTSPPDETAYASDMTVITNEVFEASGTLRFTARHKVEDSGYWSSKVFRILDQNTESVIQLEEKPHNGVGFNIRSPENQEHVLDSTTANTEWKTYALEVDFDNDRILTVERDDEVYEINQDIGVDFSEFRLGLAENNCTDSFDSVSISPTEETTTETPTTNNTSVIADFEEGWNGFEVLINEKLNNGTDADAERINTDSAHGEWSIRGECSQDGQEGDVAVRKTNIDVSTFDTIVYWAKLIEGNTYGQPRFIVYEGNDTTSDNRIIRHDIRNQEQGVWEENKFDISDVSTISIDLLVGSGAGTAQEALYDYIHVI